MDIFFVISGYLISGIIFRGLVTDSFSFKDFYVKRIKRIIPNLLVVLAFVAVLGWFVATSEEYKRIGANISHSALFYQNFGLIQGEGYFNILAQNNPLLHIWSLAIEEQFYLIFPLLCYVIWGIGKRSVRTLGLFVFLLTVSSLICCFSIENSDFRFYFPLARFWELGVGICIAYLEIFYGLSANNHDQKCLSLISVVGLALIATAFYVPMSWYMPPPGLFNIVAVMGSACLIFSNTRAVVNRTILSWRWMTFIGLISYSLYLWHWPLIAYTKLFFGEPTQIELFLALVASLPISVLVYKYIENPIRRVKGKASVLIVSVLLFVLVGSYLGGKYIRKMDGFQDREIAEVLSFKEDWSYPAGLQVHSFIQQFRVSNTKKVPEIIFIGDSHMEQYHARVMDISRRTETSVGFYTAAGCFMSIGKAKDGKSCANAQKALDFILRDPGVHVLVLAQKWGDYNEKGVLENGVDAYSLLVNNFLKWGDNRSVYVLLDNPWSEGKNGEFEISKYIGSRFNLREKFEKLNVFVPLPKDRKWSDGNKFLVDKLKDKVFLINADKYICPEGVCNLKNYKDDDHLRASYVKDHAFWIDQVFSR